MTNVEFSLSERLSSTEGSITLSGAQALMRVPVDQYRADTAKGIHTATLVSGYRGSPLAGIESIIAKHQKELDRANVSFISGVNEELAATVIWGSQMTELERTKRYDGVLGIWYGKGPGVDRSGDAFRHANFSGVSRYGGVLACAGDDPECKSSTIPSASEIALYDAGMPVLYPADVADVLRLGRFGFELSRASGLWVGFKIHTDVADGFATVPTAAGSPEIVDYTHEVDGKPWTHKVDNNLIAPMSVMLEEQLFGERTEAALGFARENVMSRSFGSTKPWLGIIVAGKPVGDVVDALATLGIGDQLDELGIAVYVPAMISPLEPQALRAFASPVDTLLVIEEKRSFIEAQVRDTLYDDANPPRVYGKRDQNRDVLIPGAGALNAQKLVEPLRRVLELKIDPGRLRKERERIPLLADQSLPGRTPYFCSGCPHNRSTVVPEGSSAAGGIGCSTMAVWMDRDTDGLTQMGGEGAQWVGTAPFIDEDHRFQNIGDGTLYHSGSLAIRQAISAGANVTFKILYNHVVAMTGGQDAAGEMGVPALTRMLEAEGVKAIVVVTNDVDQYSSSDVFAKGVRVVDREEFDAVQRQLRDISGVTALVYDQGCAADLRRQRKRKTAVTPTTRVMINEAICEGCGHCGEVSNCMSVHPVDTPLGRKTRIHQESCNYDLSCLGGNCPAFVTVEIDPNDKVSKAALGASFAAGDRPDEPERPSESTLLIVGVGGTGVVTASQVLSTAAMLDDKVATSLDQTGLAQKGGQVISNLHLASEAYEGAARVGVGSADALLLFDVVGGSMPAVLDRGEPGHTRAVISTSRVPTGKMVSNIEHETFPEIERFRTRIDAATNASENVWIDAEAIARHVWASQPAANMLVVGMAYQMGLIPVASTAIEKAIELNGVAIEMNQQAFTLGRRVVANPELREELAVASTTTAPKAPEPTAAVRRLIDKVPERSNELEEILQWRVPELIAWGNEAYAAEYIAAVSDVRRSEITATTGSGLSEVAARHLFKLMAYKDEYEVARLALDADMEAQAKALFGPNAFVSYQLKPPSLKKVGFDKKIAIPSSAARKTFASLLKTKRLRGTRFDPFGKSEERKIERELITEYRGLLSTLTDGLSAETFDRAVEIADLADQIRGFDDVKLDNVRRYRQQVTDALTTLG